MFTNPLIQLFTWILGSIIAITFPYCLLFPNYSILDSAAAFAVITASVTLFLLHVTSLQCNSLVSLVFHLYFFSFCLYFALTVAGVFSNK